MEFTARSPEARPFESWFLVQFCHGPLASTSSPALQRITEQQSAGASVGRFHLSLSLPVPPSLFQMFYILGS
ncbi:hypothetical protein QR680_003774 [Steinernema hermaphroditum]|uniref:Uncharacterized protein n=1 Tax=Steinernema hermaphroditum TaxID=289476 RepID=A0AA39HLH4_9BILA|nr:hypothetical protein QR680_003774 [Steinernema hermaphroditum]